MTNQLPYNLLYRGIESGILPASAAKGMGVLCYSPLQQGLLTGRFTKSEDVPEGRRRTRLFAGDSTPKSRHGGPGAEPGRPRAHMLSLELSGASAVMFQIA